MRILIFNLLIVFSVVSFGQVQRCSTDEYIDILKQKGFYQNQEKRFSTYNSYSGNYVIPVVVHVLYNNEEENISDERIYSQIETLNQDYNALNPELDNVPVDFQDVIGNVGLSFCLVQKDLDGNNFSGINRVYTNIESFNMSDDAMKNSSEGGVDAWDTENYLNFWVCNLSGNLLGFATMPSDDILPELDGVVIDYEYFGVNLSSESPYNLGRTGTHEVGHYFNLEHTFLAGCSDWDNCTDTPSITSPTYGCPEFPQESCNTVDMTMNYMDYANDACMYMFTICQANLMINALLNYRPHLISDSDCSVSIDDNSIRKDILIYPNPVLNEIDINVTDIWIRIYDLYGRIVFSKYIIDTSVLDLSHLESGTYFVYFDNNYSKFIKK